MRLDTDSADLRARLAQVEAERDATQRENAELRRRLAEMVEQAARPRGAYRPPEIGYGSAFNVDPSARIYFTVQGIPEIASK